MKKMILVLVLFAGAGWAETVDRLVLDPKIISSWDGLLQKYLDFREVNGPLVPPSVSYSDVYDSIKNDKWSFLTEPKNWQFKFTGGTYYVAEDSKFLKLKEPLHVLIYEDIQRGEIVILTSGDGEKFKGEALFDAPELFKLDGSASSLTSEEERLYIFDELAPRRIIWQIMLKPEADAWSDLISKARSAPAPTVSVAEVGDLGSGGMMAMMGGPPPEHTNSLWMGISGTNLTVYVPENFTNRVELYSTTDLVSNIWTVAVQGLLPVNTNPAIWVSSLSGPKNYIRAGNMDVDTDGDSLPDARESIVHKTDPNDADTDGDQMPDGWEVQYGFDPLGSADGGYDPDKDCRSNLEEYLAGTRPDNSLPLEIGFENDEMFIAGELDAQNYWEALSGAVVQSNRVFSGAQAVQCVSGPLSVQRELITDDLVVTNEAVIFLSNCAGVPGVPPAGATSAIGYDLLTGLLAYDSDEWVTVPGTVNLATRWVRLKIVQDYGAKTWALWLDGMEKLTGLGFKNTSVEALSRIHIEKGAMGSAFLDEVVFSGN